MNWRQEVDEVLVTGMKYCFKTVDGKYPELDMKAYEETEEGSLGFLDMVLALVSDLRKKAYFAGYKTGARDAYLDLVDALPPETVGSFDEQIANTGAWNGWREFEEERE